MRHSRTDLVAVLTIVAGGVIGASISFKLVSSGDVPAPVSVVVPSATPELAIEVELPNGKVFTSVSIEINGVVAKPVSSPSGTGELAVQTRYRDGRAVTVSGSIEYNGMVITPVVAPWAADDVLGMQYCPDTCGEPRILISRPLTNDRTAYVLSLGSDWERMAQPFFSVDGMRIGGSHLSLNLDDMESITVVREDAAVALYGHEAAAGVIEISLTEGPPPPSGVEAIAAHLVREQQYIEAEMNRLIVAREEAYSDAARSLFARKEAMYEEVMELELTIGIARLRGQAEPDLGDASGLAEAMTRLKQARLDEQEVSGLARAASTIKDDKLKERIRYSRGLIGHEDGEYTRAFEAETTRILEELQEELLSAISLPLSLEADRSVESALGLMETQRLLDRGRDRAEEVLRLLSRDQGGCIPKSSTPPNRVPITACVDY